MYIYIYVCIHIQFSFILFRIVTQYSTPTQKIGNGTANAAILIPTSYLPLSIQKAPANSISASTPITVDDAKDIRPMLIKLVQGGIINPNNNSYYPIHFAPGINVNFSGYLSCRDFCAYHNAIDITNVVLTATTTKTSSTTKTTTKSSSTSTTSKSTTKSSTTSATTKSNTSSTTKSTTKSTTTRSSTTSSTSIKSSTTKTTTTVPATSSPTPSKIKRYLYYGIINHPGDCNSICGAYPTDLQNIGLSASHELAEAITDPIVLSVDSLNNPAYPIAWTDPVYGEIADFEVCLSDFTNTSVVGANGVSITVQKIWSVADNACLAYK